MKHSPLSLLEEFVRTEMTPVRLLWFACGALLAAGAGWGMSLTFARLPEELQSGILLAFLVTIIALDVLLSPIPLASRCLAWRRSRKP